MTSHGDEAVKMLNGFEAMVSSEEGGIPAVECAKEWFFG